MRGGWWLWTGCRTPPGEKFGVPALCSVLAVWEKHDLTQVVKLHKHTGMCTHEHAHALDYINGPKMACVDQLQACLFLHRTNFDPLGQKPTDTKLQFSHFQFL